MVSEDPTAYYVCSNTDHFGGFDSEFRMHFRPYLAKGREKRVWLRGRLFIIRPETRISIVSHL